MKSLCGVPLRHLHDLLDPVHIGGHTDEDVGLPRVSAAPHGNDHALENPAVPVLTRQRAAVVSLQTHRNNNLESLFVSVMTDCHWRGWKHLAVTYCPPPPIMHMVKVFDLWEHINSHMFFT